MITLFALAGCPPADFVEPHVASGESLPTAPSVEISPQAPNPGDVLQCDVTEDSVDPAGWDVTYRYEWWVDGVRTLQAESELSGTFVGPEQRWTCLVTPDASGREGRIGQDSVLVNGDNIAPSIPEITLSPVAPATDQALVCEITLDAYDPDGDELSYEFSWLVNGQDAGLDGQETIASSETLVGELWTCQVRAHDGKDAGSPAEAEVEIFEPLPCADGELREYEASRYVFCNTALPWTEAREVCRAEGQDLVTIGGGDEKDWLLTSARTLAVQSSDDDAQHRWIGLNDHDLEGDIAWSDGTEFVGYEDWAEGDRETNNSDNNDAAYMIVDGGGDDGSWAYTGTGERLAYICESQ